MVSFGIDLESKGFLYSFISKEKKRLAVNKNIASMNASALKKFGLSMKTEKMLALWTFVKLSAAQIKPGWIW